MAIRVEAVSFEWIEQVIRTTGLVAATSAASPSGVPPPPSGWAMACWAFRYSSSFRMLASDETNAAM